MMKRFIKLLIPFCAGALLLQCPVFAAESMENWDYYAFPNSASAKNSMAQIVISCYTNWSMSVNNSYIEMENGKIPQGDKAVTLRKKVKQSLASVTGKLSYEPTTLTYDVSKGSKIVVISLATDIKRLPKNKALFRLSYLTKEGCVSVKADYAAAAVLSPDGTASIEDVKGEVSITTVDKNGDSISVKAVGGGELSDDFTVTPIESGVKIMAPAGKLLVTSVPEGKARLQKSIVSPGNGAIVVVKFPNSHKN